MSIKDLPPEFVEKAQACGSVEELHSLAKKVGVPLTDEDIDEISGGSTWDDDHDCPLFGKHHWVKTGKFRINEDGSKHNYEYICTCGDSKWVWGD